MIKRFFSVILALILGSLLVFIYWSWASQPVNPKNNTPQVFVVPQGQSAKIIASRLKQSGFIKNELVFRLLVDQKNLSAKLQAGDFRLSPSMNLEQIIESLTHGSLDYWITFPEGLRVEEYAERLAAKSSLIPQDFILAAKPYEGQLFPDTYLIPQSASVEDIVNLLVDTFKSKSSTQDKQMIILASLIEREAKHEADRILVSSVFHNRLKINLALQVDATVQYVLGKTGNWWPKDLTHDNLKIASPYNTYLNPGLPPRPICNPGLSSLQAALNPAQTNYLYYVSDSSGYNHYAATLSEHNVNIAKYLLVDNP
ncbi:MAG: endolytic transglycosylase MltG [Candidatus Beckwithbacteria bacterium]|nr:endolytic transglycosylase MltG [Candidatus Beckwithbacteria bacterium]